MDGNGTTLLHVMGERVNGTHCAPELPACTPAHGHASTTGHCEIIG